MYHMQNPGVNNYRRYVDSRYKCKQCFSSSCVFRHTRGWL